MHLRFKILFWSGVALFLVVSAFASWGLFELKSTMLMRRSAYNMQMTLHSMLESLQEADIVFLLARSASQEAQVKKVVALVANAHSKAVALTKMTTPNEPIRQEIAELEILLRDKVKTEDEFRVSGDMFQEPVVKKITTMRDNLILTETVHQKITNVDHLLIDYQIKHLAYVDKYFDMNIVTISAGVLLSFILFLLFANLVSREIDRRTRLEVELRKAQQAAITASALKSQFLATVSHEVRTPLNGIIGMSELIRRQAQGELKKYAGVIHDSGRNLLRIVNDILDFSRIEANRMELELQEVQLSSLFETACELFSTRAVEKKLLLVARYEREFEHFFAADGSRISQVLQNLLGNAIKFTHAGQVILLGRMVQEEGGEYLARFSVEDTGVGIPEDKTGVIFQPFEQTATDHQREGTGLGLSISKRLVEMMGGTIQFESQAGQGSRFWFDLRLRKMRSTPPRAPVNFEIVTYKLAASVNEAIQEYATSLGARWSLISDLKGLVPTGAERVLCCDLEHVRELEPELQKGALVIDFPSSHAPYAWRFLSLPLTLERFLKSADAQPLELEKGATPSPSQALVARGSGLILLVEDNATNQMLAQTQLEQFGYRVHVAQNGQDCLEAMQRTNYDLILMDCRMPVMDGYQTTQAIRERERQRQAVRVPIVAITANALLDDRHRCLAAGMDDYLTKPIAMNELNERMQKWIRFDKTEIDWRVVSDLANRTSNDVVKRLIHSFQNTLGSALARVETALAAGAWGEILADVHQLKSSAAALGAVALAQLCTQIESQLEVPVTTAAQAPSDNGSILSGLCTELVAVGQRVLKELSDQSKYT